MLEPTADFLALLGKRIALEASLHGDSSQEVEEQLYRIQAKLDNTLRGKEQDISETLKILSAILKKNNVSDDDADEYGFWKKTKQKLTSPKAKKIYKIAGKIAIRLIGWASVYMSKIKSSRNCHIALTFKCTIVFHLTR